MGRELGFSWFSFFSLKRSCGLVSGQALSGEALLPIKCTVFPITFFGSDPPQSTP